MEIADVPAALTKVRQFIVTLERGKDSWSRRGSEPQIWDQGNNEILERLPLISQITARAGAVLPRGLTNGNYIWPYDGTLEASLQLAGLLDSAEEAERILGPVGPKLEATNRPRRWPCLTAIFRRS